MTGDGGFPARLARRVWRGLSAFALLLLAALSAGAGAPASLASDPRQDAAEQPPSGAPTVESISVVGAQRYSEKEIIAMLGQKLGEPLDLLVIDQGIKELSMSLKVQTTVLYRETPGGVELRVEVEEYAYDPEPRFIGHAAFSTEDLLEWAGITEFEELYTTEAPRVRQRILANYQREGYYWAEVDIVQRGGPMIESGTAADVIFDIREGPRVRVEDVVVRGNRSLPDKGALWWATGLRSFAKPALRGPAWKKFRFRGSKFVEEELEADLIAMREAYRERGWFDAIVEVEKLDFNTARDRVRIVIRVDEGEPYRLSALELIALAPSDDPDEPSREVELLFPREQLFELFELRPGRRFQQTFLDHDRLALRSYYGERGYLDHPSLDPEVRWTFLEPRVVFDPENHTVAITYRIRQGRPVELREIDFAGNLHTRDKVLRSRVSVFPGEQANQNEIERSLRRIRNTGFFSDDFNRLEHVEPTFRFRPVDGHPDVVDLEFLVEEGRVVDANLAGGVDSNDGLFGLITLSMRNFDIASWPSSFLGMFGEIYRKEAFHGAGQRLDIELSPGTQLSRFRFRYFVPDLLGTDLNPIGLDFDIRQRLRIFDNFDEDRFTSRVRLVRRYENDLLLALGLTYGSVEVDDVEDDAPPVLIAQELDGRQELVGPLIELSRRDLDDLRVPHKGYSWRLESTVFGEMLGGDITMVTTQGSADWYLPVRENTDGLSHVFHAGIDFGVHQPYGPTEVVPYSERFQLGGRSSLRGLGFREVGPFDAGGDPLGGETFVSGTFEYFVPLTSIPRPDGLGRLESLRGSLFLDYGALDPDPFIIDPDEIRVTAGFGVGLVYPLPIQLNFGFPVVSKDGDETQVLTFVFSFAN